MADRHLTASNLAIAERLDAFCNQRGKTLLQLAFSWLAAQPCVASVIAGASRPEQIADNVAAPSWPLSDEDVREINRVMMAQPS